MHDFPGRVIELGTGLALDATDATPEQIRQAINSLLDEPSYRRESARMRDEIENQPGPDATIALLEAL